MPVPPGWGIVSAGTSPLLGRHRWLLPAPWAGSGGQGLPGGARDAVGLHGLWEGVYEGQLEWKRAFRSRHLPFLQVLAQPPDLEAAVLRRLSVRSAHVRGTPRGAQLPDGTRVGFAASVSGNGSGNPRLQVPECRGRSAPRGRGRGRGCPAAAPAPRPPFQPGAGFEFWRPPANRGPTAARGPRPPLHTPLGGRAAPDGSKVPRCRLYTSVTLSQKKNML